MTNAAPNTPTLSPTPSPESAEPQPIQKQPFLSPEISSYFIAGGFAGAASRTVVSPLERLKIIQLGRLIFA
jgi:solute carrier family 25 phosphate transporter 23/24/25/41